MNIFEDMRRANTDFYVAHPLTFLEKEQLAALAEAHGMTVDELKAHLMQPRIESTCPLCGRPSTHLVQCNVKCRPSLYQECAAKVYQADGPTPRKISKFGVW